MKKIHANQIDSVISAKHRQTLICCMVDMICISPSMKENKYTKHNNYGGCFSRRIKETEIKDNRCVIRYCPSLNIAFNNP